MCNSSISLPDFEGNSMGFMFLYKGLSTKSCHYISMVTVGNIWYQCDYIDIIRLSLKVFVSPILFICYFIKEAHDRNTDNGQ